jgi:hypothetical protein
MSIEKSDLLLLLIKPYVPFYIPRKAGEKAKSIVAPPNFLLGSEPTNQPSIPASCTKIEVSDLTEDEKLKIENLREEDEKYFSLFVKSHAKRSAKLTKIFMGKF